MRFFSALLLFVTLIVSPKAYALMPWRLDPDDVRVIEVTESGVYPRELDISTKDLFVFLLNNSHDSLITFEVDYGKHDMHCVNDNIANSTDGKARSINPLSPRDFATPCFHEPGSYPIRFYGVGGKPEPVTATVVLK